MKIVIINGQNHQGSTWHIGHTLVEKIQGEKEVIEFFLPRDLNHFCLGCYSCLKERERCPYWDDKEKMNNAILEADVLILTTPNYCMMPSAAMKSFLDLFFTNWFIHKPYQEMFTKKAIVISTTAGKGAKNAAKLVAQNLKNWGIPKVMTYSVVVNAMNWEMIPEKIKVKIDRDTDKLADQINKKVHVGIQTKAMFYFARILQKANWGSSIEEKEYWIHKGWLDKERPWKY